LNPATDQRILARGHCVLRAEAEAVLDADRRLGESFIRAVRMILGCKGRVGVTGVGKAGLIGGKIQATLASTGTLSYPLHPVEALHGDIGMIHADDVILALSRSGGSELVELLPVLRNLGCKIILLTARTDSACARHSDVALDIGQTEEACPLGLAPSSSAAAISSPICAACASSMRAGATSSSTWRHSIWVGWPRSIAPTAG